MITVDTNVLLRYLLQDDEVQAERADAVFNGSETVLIRDVVNRWNDAHNNNFHQPDLADC